jgi:hypothetical protein
LLRIRRRGQRERVLIEQRLSYDHTLLRQEGAPFPASIDLWPDEGKHW